MAEIKVYAPHGNAHFLKAARNNNNLSRNSKVSVDFNIFKEETK